MTIRATDANNNSAAACGRRQSSPCSPCPAEGPALRSWQPAPRGPLHAAPAHPRAVSVPTACPWQKLLWALPLGQVVAEARSCPAVAGDGSAAPAQGPSARRLPRCAQPAEHVLHPARWFSGKRLKGLFFRKPHYSIMFMCSHVHVILFTAWNISSLIS